ncbi:interleukin-13 receptor subunit alpha-2 [Aplochiton taeniatus]
MSSTMFILGVTFILIIGWSNLSDSLKVDPPVDVVILDPGHLGNLHIHWKPPASLLNLIECSQQFQLEYLNTYRDTWIKIRTSQTSFKAQFDLEKEIRVRIYTLLTGVCANGSEVVMSTLYTELVQQPAHLGPAGTRVQNFECVFYRREYIECTWLKGHDETVASQRRLFFWHRALGHAKECQHYIYSNTIRRGCNFTHQALPEFTNINFCVNGSSTDGPLRPAFHSLQMQNQIKPAQTTVVRVQAGPDRVLKLHWECPQGRVPRHCLEWEVEHKQDTRTGIH